jgi:hypothetical protein
MNTRFRHAALAPLMLLALTLAIPAGAQTRATPPKAEPQKGGPVKPAAAKPAQKKPVPAKKRTGKHVWSGTGFLGFDGGMQATSESFKSTVTTTLNVEQATFDATYSGKSAAMFGARGGMRVWRNLAVGAGLSIFTRTGDAAITGRLPHPFYFNQFRDVTGTAPGLKRDETMVAVEATWLAPINKKLSVAIFGGPAFITIRQDMATSLQVTETYPYDKVTLTGVSTASVSKSVAGFTVGADIVYLLSRTVGLGGQVRYSRGSADLEPEAGQTTRVNVGGLQASAGLRFRF